jgi:hypothetical protein
MILHLSKTNLLNINRGVEIWTLMYLTVSFSIVAYELQSTVFGDIVI